MVDLHAHLLPNIDDGSGCIEDSFLMLDDAMVQGVTDIVLTTHLNDSYSPTVCQVKSAFEEFQNKASDKGYNINLYLGQEIYVGNGFEKVFSKKEFLTLNGTNFVLLEFDYVEEFDIAEQQLEDGEIINFAWYSIDEVKALILNGKCKKIEVLVFC